MQQAQDFLDESNALYQLLSGLSDEDYGDATQFKGWTINMVLRHLHVWNHAASSSHSDEQEFGIFLKEMAVGIKGGSLPQFEEKLLGGLSGCALRDSWMKEAELLAARFATVDPSARLPWVGPSMSARSSITARLMESWAHGQAIYDLMGVERIDTDRIGNVVRLGVNTYEWCFRNRRIDLPGPMPKVTLTAPSGAVWNYGEGEGNILGLATEFCQVVTQTRNVEDTALVVSGALAKAWMAIAQCFAGPPVDPPKPGMRHCKKPA